MDSIDDTPCNQHLLFLGQADVRLLVGRNEFSEMDITLMAVTGPTTSTQHIVCVGFLNVQTDCGGGGRC